MALTRITKQAHFHAGHRVPNHGSKCRMPHGHTYHVEITIEGNLVDSHGDEQEGMVLDFGFLKELIQRHVRDTFDHKFIVYNEDPLLDHLNAGAVDGLYEPDAVVRVSYIPTAENIAGHIFLVMKGAVAQRTDDRAWLVEVKVWETPTSSAAVTGAS